MTRIKNFTSYVSNLTDLLWNYIENTTAYPNNAVLAVQKEIKETVIENPALCKNCDFYNINDFIRLDSTGSLTPNSMAIQKLAGSFFLNKTVEN